MTLSLNGVERGLFSYRHNRPREFKKLRRPLQRKRHIKIEFCVRLSVLFCDYSLLVTLHEIGEVYVRLLGTNGFHVKAENERFTAEVSRCRRNLKCENFTSSLGNPCRTCSTIIFPHSTNQTINLCRCHRRFLNSVCQIKKGTPLKQVKIFVEVKGQQEVPRQVTNLRSQAKRICLLV